MAEAPGAVLTGHGKRVDPEQLHLERMIQDQIRSSSRRLAVAFDRLGIKGKAYSGDIKGKALDLRQLPPPSKIKTENWVANGPAFKVLDTDYKPSRHDHVNFDRWTAASGHTTISLEWVYSGENGEPRRESIYVSDKKGVDDSPSYFWYETSGEGNKSRTKAIKFEGHYGDGPGELHYGDSGEERRFTGELEATVRNVQKIARAKTPLPLRLIGR